MLHTEFRDGNVPAGHEQLRVLKESLAMLPEGVEKVRLRSDTGPDTGASRPIWLGGYTAAENPHRA